MGASKELYMSMMEELAHQAEAAEGGRLTYLEALYAMREARQYMKDGLQMIADWEDQNQDEILREAEQYPEGYQGKIVEYRGGRKLYSFKDIPEWQQINEQKKEIENKYKAMFDAKLKGATYANVDENGEELPLPALAYGKGSIILKNK